MTEAEQRIRETLAAGPTPGPWYLRTNRHPTTDGRAWGWLDTQPPGGSQYAPPGLQITWERGSKSEANAAFIAACDPENIAAILAQIERLRARLDAMAKDAERYRHLRKDGLGVKVAVLEESEDGWGTWVSGYPPSELDAAIDAQIEKEDNDAAM